MKYLLCVVTSLLYSCATFAREPITTESVEAFFDRAWEEELSMDGAVPGSVISVVHDGTIVLSKGYGTRDISTGAPVDPDNTRVRIGSTSKLFTAMTALALLDEGKLEMDRDINDYLVNAQVPATFDDPVTVRSLLSHLSGFDTAVGGWMSYDNNELSIDWEQLERRMIRVRPVGRVYSYDNTGTGLLGHVSGIANGTTYAEAVREQLLEPLGMNKTAMGVPDSQLEDLAACHTWNYDGQPILCTHKFMRAVYQGAGAISTTASDMARFMLANLDNSCLDGRCVLSQSTFDQFVDMDINRFHPMSNGMGYIMVEFNQFGPRSIGHSGGMDGFTTWMVLYPETRTGVFISQFAYGGIPMYDNISWLTQFARRSMVLNPAAPAMKTISDFAGEFLPEPEEQLIPAEDFSSDDLALLAGSYAMTHTAGSMLHTLMMTMLMSVRVSVTGDEVTIASNGPFRQTGERLLTMEGDDAYWMYRISDDQVLLQNREGVAVAMLEKQAWHWNAALVVLPLLLPVLLALPALIYAVLKRREPVRFKFGLLLGFCGLAVTAGLFLEFEYFSRNYFFEGPTAALAGWRLLINLGWLASLASLWLAVTRRSELFGFAGFGAAMHTLLVTLFAFSAIAVALIIPYWGLLANFSQLPG